MLEIDKSDDTADNMQFIAKTIFDLVRNTLIIATVGYFKEKTGSNTLSVIYIALQAVLAMNIMAIFLKFRFRKNFFSDTRGGVLFGIVLSTVVAGFVALFVIGATNNFIKEAISAQNKDFKCPTSNP